MRKLQLGRPSELTVVIEEGFLLLGYAVSGIMIETNNNRKHHLF